MIVTEATTTIIPIIVIIMIITNRVDINLAFFRETLHAHKNRTDGARATETAAAMDHERLELTLLQVLVDNLGVSIDALLRKDGGGHVHSGQQQRPGDAQRQRYHQRRGRH